jgi:SAM-dependent methyltransferase
MSDSPNYFAHAAAAARYARGRPYHHPAIVRKICEVTGVSRFASVLDVGCGTGQSTQAIAEIAAHVFGIDVSPEMLAQATPGPNINYQQAAAERLPFASRSFDLVTVGLAFHWLHQEEFLAEAHRVLLQSGWLVIYNSGFLGELEEEPEFGRWYRECYLSRYPWPPRSPTNVSADFAHRCDFAFIRTETVRQAIPMSGEQFVNYLLTQSNVIAKVEQGAERLEAVAQFLRNAVAPYFHSETRSLQWQSDLDFLRPAR